MPQFIPAPAAGGGGASFAYDGATFTPGTFVADSGTRTMDVELTNGGAAIASGNLFYQFSFFSDANLTAQVMTNDPYLDNVVPGTWDIVVGIAFANTIGFSFFQANGSNALFTMTLVSSNPAAMSVWIGIVMLDGSIELSDEFSVPGVGA